MLMIQADTREHAEEWERISKQFKELGVKYFRSKLYVGDYMNLDNAKLVVDRKKDLSELAANVCQQHERFKAELIRAMQAGIKIIILCEHGEDVNSLEDVYFWQNPRKHEIKWKWQNGKKIKYVASEKAVDGVQLYRSLCTIRDRYNVQFEFCTKDQTGRKIVDLLNDNRRD